MLPDIINGLFESVAGFMILLHILRLRRDKQVRGLHILPVIFFTAWGFWNIYYYPHLEQWWSFAGGIFIVIMNVVWVLQIWYYIRQEQESRKILERLLEKMKTDEAKSNDREYINIEFVEKLWEKYGSEITPDLFLQELKGKK